MLDTTSAHSGRPLRDHLHGVEDSLHGLYDRVVSDPVSPTQLQGEIETILRQVAEAERALNSMMRRIHATS